MCVSCLLLKFNLSLILLNVCVKYASLLLSNIFIHISFLYIFKMFYLFMHLYILSKYFSLHSFVTFLYIFSVNFFALSLYFYLYFSLYIFQYIFPSLLILIFHPDKIFHRGNTYIFLTSFFKLEILINLPKITEMWTRRKMQYIFLLLRRIFSGLYTWKISRAKTNKGRLMGMPLFLLRRREKYFSYSFVIPTCNTYVYIPRLGDEGWIQSRGIRGRLFAAVNTPVDGKRHKYRWLLSRNRISRHHFRGPFPLTGAACQLLYAQFVCVDHDSTRCNCYFHGTEVHWVLYRLAWMYNSCIRKRKYYNCI